MGKSKLEDFVERLDRNGSINSVTCRQVACEASWNFPVFKGIFWSTRQRTANPLHEIPYRASFKAALPEFLIEHLSSHGESVLDPFSGRGTTALAAALMGRRSLATDVNPLSEILLRPRLMPPSIYEVEKAVRWFPLHCEHVDEGDPLLAFFHRETLGELKAWQKSLNHDSSMDRWLRLVITSRLTGHSKGFFSVYTLPPNQAVTIARQQKINERRGVEPDYRSTKPRIIAKSRALLRSLTESAKDAMCGRDHLIGTCSVLDLKMIADGSIELIVTSPPFLNLVDYKLDNWLRCWFNGIDLEKFEVATPSSLRDWQQFMGAALKEMARVLKPHGVVAIEVGDVKSGQDLLVKALLEECGAAGLKCRALIINTHKFSKTSQCWSLGSNTSGTNSNRVLLLNRV